MNAQKYLSDLIMLSQYAGMREDLTQAGGGNSSVKLDDETMLIKASGYQLSEISEQQGIAKVNYSKIKLFMQEADLDNTEEDEGNRVVRDAMLNKDRPSIEVYLHALSDTVTLHTHPLAVNILATREGGMKELSVLFPEAVFVCYATPGIKLASTYYKACVKGKKEKPQLVFLQNHGLIVSAPSAQLVIAETERVVSTIEKYTGVSFEQYRQSTMLWTGITQSGGSGIVWSVNDANILKAYELLNGIWEYAFVPDCSVYCGLKALKIQEDETNLVEVINQHRLKYGHAVIIEYQNHLYINAPTVKKAMEIQSVLSFSAQVALANRNCKINYLSEREQFDLLNWEAEKYRQSH